MSTMTWSGFFAPTAVLRSLSNGAGEPSHCGLRTKSAPCRISKTYRDKGNEIRARRTMRKKQGFTAGAALLLTGYVIVRLGIGYLFGLGMLLAGIVVIGYVRRKDKAAQVDARILQAKIDALSGRTG